MKSPTTGLYLPGSSGNYVSTPDDASLDITGDMEIIVKAALIDWTPAAVSTLISKYSTVGDQRSWFLAVETNGTLTFRRSITGITTAAYTSTVPTGITDASAKFIKCTFQQNNGSGQSVARFYLSADTESWTELGSPIAVGDVSSTFSGTAIVEIGSITTGTANLATGIFYYASIASSLGGVPVAEFDARRPTPARYKGRTGKIWTINGSAWAWQV